MDSQSQPTPADSPAAAGPAEPLGYQPRAPGAPGKRRQDHLRGKLVVLSLIGLGLLLGLIALPFRKLTPKRPVTQPAVSPATVPTSRPS